MNEEVFAPSASTAQAFERESGIRIENHATVVSDPPCGDCVGSLRNLRASFTGTLLVVDESTFVSGEWMRGLPGITTATGVPPGVALLGDEHQLDGVEASKPFARLRQGGMMAAAMEENFRQRIAKLKSTT